MRAGILAAMVALAWLAATPGLAAPKAEVALWRLDCGRFVEKQHANGCYLVRHGDRYLLWDAGLGAELAGRGPQRVNANLVALDVSLEQQLAAIELRTDQIGIVALSHSHFDHIGQAAAFPRATLMIGRADWEDFLAHPFALSARVAPWIGGGAPRDLVEGDRDIFGDGTVVMIATPGHTPGHHSLILRLRRSGPVMLTGDLYVSEQQRREGAVTRHNPDPVTTRASYRRFERLARRLRAMVVVGHDPADVARLPAFPAAAD